MPKGKRMPSTTKVVTRGNKKHKTPPGTPDSPTPPTSEGEGEGEGEARSQSRDVTPPPTQEASCSQAPKKRPNVISLVLTPEQEEELADWLKSFDFIYVKDTNMKKRVWETQAKKMGLDVKQLHTWYESVRSKIGKLTDRKLGSATKELSDRDKYLLDKFGFLKDHIVRQPSRVGSSLKSKLLALQPQSQATATATCSGSDKELPDTQTLQQTQPQPSAEREKTR